MHKSITFKKEIIMESVLIPLVVALITAIIGPLVTLTAAKRLAQKDYPTSSIQRDERLVGVWKGYFEQENRNNSSEIIKTEFLINLNKKGRGIYGSGNFSLVDEKNVSVVLQNGMFDGSLLKIDYRNSKNIFFNMEL